MDSEEVEDCYYGFGESELEELLDLEEDSVDHVGESGDSSDKPQEVETKVPTTAGSVPKLAGDAADADTMTEPPQWRMALNTHKAGMQGLDKEYVNRIIHEASKNSLFYQNEMKKEKLVEARVAKQQEELKRVSSGSLRLAKQQADKYIEVLESKRRLDRYVVHVDMDAFYAAVEILHQPHLADKPMAVGGMGMLSTSNYVARKFGVRAGMPGFIGKKLCPDLILVKSHFDRYREASQQVRKILADYDPDFEPVGLDESFLDVTDYLERRMQEQRQAYRCHRLTRPPPDKHSGVKQFTVGDVTGDVPIHESISQYIGDDCSSDDGHWSMPGFDSASEPGREADNQEAMIRTHGLTSEQTDIDGCQRAHPLADDGAQHGTASFGNSLSEVLREMIFRIHQQTGLTASAGVAANRRLAKICSDRNKPNGIYILPNDLDTILTFVRQLPIRKVNGIGKVSERLIKALGINTCGDLYDKRELIWALHSPGTSQYYMDISLGIGSSSVSSAEEYQSKSISVERTFRELNKPAELLAKCRDLCERLAEDLEKEKMEGKTVTLKLKEVTFKVRSRAVSLPLPVSSADALYSAASSSLKSELAASKSPLRLRLMGVRLSALQRVEKKQQMSLTQFMQTAPINVSGSGNTAKADVLEVPPSESATAANCVKTSSPNTPECSEIVPSIPSVSRSDATCRDQAESRSDATCRDQAESVSPVLMVKEASGTAETEGTNASTPPSLSDDTAEAAPSSGPTCPICGKLFLALDNRELNEHVDDCLNTDTIKTLAPHSSQMLTAGSKWSLQSHPSTSASADIRKSGKSLKRHAAAPSSRPTKKKPACSTRTLDSLWAAGRKS